MTSLKDQEQYWADNLRPYRYVPVREFAEKFKKFGTGERMLQDLAVPYPKEKSHPAALCKKKYAGTRMELFKTNFSKEFLLYKRNAVITIFKALQVLRSSHAILPCIQSRQWLQTYVSDLVIVYFLTSSPLLCMAGVYGGVHLHDGVLQNKVAPADR